VEKIDDLFEVFRQFQPEYISEVFAEFFDNNESITDRINPGQVWVNLITVEPGKTLASSIFSRAYLKARKSVGGDLSISKEHMHELETEILVIIKAMDQQGFFNFSFIDQFVQ